MKNNQSGYLLIDKPTDITSNGVLGTLRKKLGIKKMGHSGTLDPFATGLLFVVVGEGTKFLPYIITEPKEYEATLLLGQETDTLDSEGVIIKSAPVSEINPEDLLKVTQQLVGERVQLSPAYSAKKIDGERSYDKARRGETVERKPCTITIYGLDLKVIAPNQIALKVLCSTGTYVRVLGEEIANLLGTVGHLIALRRTRMGNFSVSEAAVDPSQIKINPISSALSYPTIYLESGDYENIRQGRSIKKETPEKGIVSLMFENNFLGMGEMVEGILVPKRLMQDSAG